MRNIISEFRGKYGFLSNFHSCAVEFEGLTFNSSEAAFQATKIHYEDTEKTLKAREAFVDVTASESKKMGRHCDLREDWEQVKDNIMTEIIRDKFNRNTELKDKLLETGDSILIEGTKWHDNYWGNCVCSKCKNTAGKNKLGSIIMQVRTELVQ